MGAKISKNIKNKLNKKINKKNKDSQQQQEEEDIFSEFQKAYFEQLSSYEFPPKKKSNFCQTTYSIKIRKEFEEIEKRENQSLNNNGGDACKQPVEQHVHTSEEICRLSG
ncbi:hypothetical protein ABK040_003145 [Willaertia magna]